MENRTTARAARITGRKQMLFLFGAIAVLFAPFCFLGYGADNDAFSVVDAGRVQWIYHQLFTSRTPGYWAFETLSYFLDRAGGSVATNLASLAMALACVWMVYRLAVRLGAAYPGLTVMCLAAAPSFVIAATTTMDYVWSLFGLLVLVEMTAEERWGLAAAGATWAYLIRTANGAVIAGIIAGGVIAIARQEGWKSRRIVKLVGVGVVAAVIGSLPLLLSYRLFGSWAFLTQMNDPRAALWTPWMRMGRFAYKGLMMFGVAATVWLTGGAIVLRGRRVQRAEGNANRTRMVAMLLGGTVLNLVLFLRYPLEISYLLPAAAFVMLLAGGWWFSRSRVFAVVFLLLVISADVVTVQLAVPNMPGVASAAKLQPGLVKGQLVEDAEQRWQVRDCKNLTCWLARENWTEHYLNKK